MKNISLSKQISNHKKIMRKHIESRKKYYAYLVSKGMGEDESNVTYLEWQKRTPRKAKKEIAKLTFTNSVTFFI